MSSIQPPKFTPDSSPILPVASDGTGVTVQTRGSQWLATVLDAEKTQSSLGIDEGKRSVIVYVCVCDAGRGSDRQITGLTHTHTPLEQKQYCLT